MALQRLSGLDAAFFAAETQTNHLHVMAVMLLDPSTVPGGYTFEKLRDAIASNLPAIAPLRRRLVTVPFRLARPAWVELPVIDVDDHVHRVQVAPPGGPREIAAFAGEVCAQRFDPERPLWKMHVLEGCADGSIAVVAKLHHSLMDGAAGMEFMASLFSLEPEGPAPGAPVGKSSDGRARIPGRVEMLVRSVPELVRQPLRGTRAIADAAQAAVRVTRHLRGPHGPVTAPGSAPRTPWNTTITGARNVAYTAVPLATIRDVAHRFGATVNDVALALVADALRRYLVERDALPEAPLTAAVPASVRGEGDDPAAVPNAVSLMIAALETQIADPVERLRAIHERMVEAKEFHEALGGDTINEWTETMAPLFFWAAVRVYTGLHLADRFPLISNLVVSTVPGPPVTLYFAGARLQAVYPLGPVYDGMGMNVTAVSSGDSFGFGFVSCPDVVEDLWEVAASVPDALAALVEAAAST